MSERLQKGKVILDPKHEYIGPYSDLIISVDGQDRGLRVAGDCGLKRGDVVVYNRGNVNSPVCMECPLRKGYGGVDECGFPCSAWNMELPPKITKRSLIDVFKDLV
jgi:hypothetical protein